MQGTLEPAWLNHLESHLIIQMPPRPEDIAALLTAEVAELTEAQKTYVEKMKDILLRLQFTTGIGISLTFSFCLLI